MKRGKKKNVKTAEKEEVEKEQAVVDDVEPVGVDAEENDDEEKQEKPKEEERKIIYGFPYEYLSPEERKRRAEDGGESDEEPQKTTIGNVPMEWYADLPHIGYDLEGKPVMKAPGWENRANVIEEFLDAKDDPDHWRKVYDARTDTEIRLSDEDMRLVSAVMNAKRADRVGIRIDGDNTIPDDGGIDWPILPVDPIIAALPLGEHDPSKAHFIKGRHETKMLLRLERLIRKGYIDPDADRKKERALRQMEMGGMYRYDVWDNSGENEEEKSKKRRAPELLPAPRLALPDHADSFNPPAEYLPNEATVQRILDDPLMNQMEKNERIANMPRKYSSLRAVPRDDRTVINVYRRCLQLYLSPRARPRRPRRLTDEERAERLRNDPRSLPSPDELKPFPTSTTLVYRGHGAGLVRAVSIDPKGQWLASGADNAELRLWEAETARCVASAYFPPVRAERNPDGDESSEMEGDDKEDSQRVTSEDFPVRACGWCPLESRRLLAFAAGTKLFIVVPNALTGDEDAATAAAIEFMSSTINYFTHRAESQAQENSSAKKGNSRKTNAQEDEGDEEENAGGEEEDEMEDTQTAAEKKKPREVEKKKQRGPGTTWRLPTEDELKCLRGLVLQDSVHVVVIDHRHEVASISWHKGGDYILVVTQNDPSHPVSQTAAIVHRISSHRSQKLQISRHAGPIQTACFHTTKPLVVVATQRSVRIYDVSKSRERALIKKLIPRVRWVSTVAVHPEGNNILMGSFDKRVCWFDLDYSSKPYKTLRHSKRAVRRVAFHPKLPLFATSSDENRTYVFHDTVSDDLLTDPVIVPLHVLHGHRTREGFGVLDICFHPTLPWLFTAGADGSIILHTDKDIKRSVAASKTTESEAATAEEPQQQPQEDA